MTRSSVGAVKSRSVGGEGRKNKVFGGSGLVRASSDRLSARAAPELSDAVESSPAAADLEMGFGAPRHQSQQKRTTPSQRINGSFPHPAEKPRMQRSALSTGLHPHCKVNLLADYIARTFAPHPRIGSV